MMNLHDHCELISSLQALDDPGLPERPASIEWLSHHARDEVLQLLQCAGLGERGVSHVVVEIEMRIVHPDGVVEHGDLVEALPISRDEVKKTLGSALDEVDVDSARFAAKGADIEDVCRGDVHAHIALFPE
jgi:hypothetical protein